MAGAEFEDLTTMFLRLQDEVEPVGVGRQKSLEAQLKIVEADLVPYFEDHGALQMCLGAGGLTYEHAFLKRFPVWSESRLATLLSEYRQARDVSSHEVYSALAAFFPQMDRAYRHVVSIAELEVDKCGL